MAMVLVAPICPSDFETAGMTAATHPAKEQHMSHPIFMPPPFTTEYPAHDSRNREQKMETSRNIDGLIIPWSAGKV